MNRLSEEEEEALGDYLCDIRREEAPLPFGIKTGMKVVIANDNPVPRVEVNGTKIPVESLELSCSNEPLEPFEIPSPINLVVSMAVFTESGEHKIHGRIILEEDWRRIASLLKNKKRNK